MRNKNRLIAYFIIISIIILIAAINVNAQWSPYMGFNFYGSPYGYGRNQPHISDYNSYSFNRPYDYGWNISYNNGAFFPPPYSYYYEGNFSYEAYKYIPFPLPPNYSSSSSDPYGYTSFEVNGVYGYGTSSPYGVPLPYGGSLYEIILATSWAENPLPYDDPSTHLYIPF